MNQKIEGVVIRSTNYGETHRILTILSKQLGKIGVIARGAKKPRSKFTSCSQLFTYGTYIIQKRNGLGTLHQGDVTESMRGIREDIEKTAYASYIIELTDRVIENDSGSPFLYNLLYQTLSYINEGKDPEVMMFIYQLKMLDFLGIRPNVDGCVSCGKENGDVVFSIRKAGFLCSSCMHQDKYHQKLSPQAATLIRALYHIDINRLGNVSIKHETKAEMKKVILDYYEEYSGLYLKSLKFINQMHLML